MQIPLTTRKRNSTVRRKPMQTLRVSEGVQLFNIQHETGDLSEWDSTVTDSGDLSVVAPGLRGSGFKMQCLIDSTGAIYGQMLVSQPSSGSFRARFYIDTDSLTMTDGNNFTIFVVIGTGSPYQLRLKQTGGVKELQLAMETDVPATSVGIAQTLPSGEHFIELLMTRATTNVSSDGLMRLLIDGTELDSVTGIDNFDRVNPVSLRLGAIAGVDVGTSGNLFLDELAVRDDDKQIGA